VEDAGEHRTADEHEQNERTRRSAVSVDLVDEQFVVVLDEPSDASEERHRTTSTERFG